MLPLALILPLAVMLPVTSIPPAVVSNFFWPPWYASKEPPAVPLKSRLTELPSTKSNSSPANSKEEPMALTLVLAFRILP
jgi:hypothetical protein